MHAPTRRLEPTGPADGPSYHQRGSALAEKGDVDVIFAMDDETAQGAYKGYLDAGFPPDTVTVAPVLNLRGLAANGEHRANAIAVK